MKVSFLGAGQVGGQAAFLAAFNCLADVCLYDSNTELAQGKALDIGQSLVLSRSSVAVQATEDLRGTADSDVIVIAAGASRRPDMKREDLLRVNAGILRELLPKALQHSPDAIVLVVTNPVSPLTCLAMALSGLPRTRVFGMAGVLDDARFKYFLARKLNCSPKDVDSLVIGDHGDYAVPVSSCATVLGRPLHEWLDTRQIADVCRQARNAGTQIVNFLKQSSAFYAPAAAIAKMLNAILFGQNSLLPCCVGLNGEYGVSGLVVGVPALLGRYGIERVIELDLSKDEWRDFRQATDFIRRTTNMLPESVANVLESTV